MMALAARGRAALRSGPLASRPFLLFTGGQFTSTAGDYCYAVALPWLVLSAHGGAALLGAVLACYGVPRTVLIPAGGWLADKAGPRAVMLGADAVRCVLVASLALIASGHVVSLALLGPLAALIGAGEGLFLPASMAMIPTLLPAGRLQTGNAVNMAVLQVGGLVGPVLGGALVAAAGSAPAFAVDAATFAVSAASLALIARARATAEPGPGQTAVDQAVVSPPADPGSSADPGPSGVVALLRRSRLLQLILVICVVANFAFAGTMEVALPALAHLRFGAAGYGALIACLGAGSVAGTLGAARAGRLRRPAPLASAAFLMEGVLLAAVPFLGGLPGAAAAMLIAGIGNGFGNTVFITLLQKWAPPRLLGRVMSLVMLASMGSFPISVLLAGLLVHRLGPAPFFPVAAAALWVAIGGSLASGEMRSFGAAAGPPPGVSPAAA